ncbi:MAG TPA: hypothetical protein PLX80_02515 [Ignavibacteria bacterium]|nr:hypothetical protein [Ignavibacteria bacterium]
MITNSRISKKLFLFFFIVLCCNEIKASYTLKSQDLITSPYPDGKNIVYISLILNNISEVNASSQLIKADIVMTARWFDPRLKHNKKGGRLEDPQKIWGPFLTFSNRLNISKSFPEQVTIHEDGTVFYTQRIFGDFTQNLNFREFPFDTQNFVLRLIEISFNSNEISLEPDPEIRSGVGKNISLSDWKIVNWELSKSEYSIIEDSQKLPSLVFNITAQRESGFYLLIFAIPLILIIMMSWIVFWLPPNLSASQISVATTSMLTLIAYRFIVTSYLPRISYLTRMDIFILGSSILIFMTLVLAASSSNLTQKGKGDLAKKYDKRFRWIFPLLYIIVIIIALTV